MPLIWALGASFKPDTITDINQIFPSPENWTFEWYQLLFSFDGEYPVLRWILNSFIVGCIHTILYLIIVSFAAYALVFLNWKFKNAIFTVVVSSMMFPGIITLVPLYNLFNSLGIAGNPTWVYLIGCILPGLGGVFGLFLIRQFFLGLPKELVEACKVDGCNNFQIFFRVILPIGKNAIFVAAIFAFLGNWNDYLWPQLIASGGVDVLGREWLTLPVGLSVLVSGRTGDTPSPRRSSSWPRRSDCNRHRPDARRLRSRPDAARSLPPCGSAPRRRAASRADGCRCRPPCAGWNGCGHRCIG